jgi:hypothetical protein
MSRRGKSQVKEDSRTAVAKAQEKYGGKKTALKKARQKGPS